MASVNRVTIVGNLGKDPEMRVFPDGTAVAQFSVATTDRYKDKKTGQAIEKTEWHRVNAFGPLAEIVGKYLKKGASVYLEGKLKTQKYTPADGVERYSTVVMANSVTMLDRKAGVDTDAHDAGAKPVASAKQATPPPPSTGFDDMDDDIPF